MARKIKQRFSMDTSVMSAPTISPILPAKYGRDETGQTTVEIPAMPCPLILTAEEAARYLRLDETEVKDPERSLKYYRQEWGLRGTRIGRNIRYRWMELEALLDRLTEQNPT